jgi:hypothetical protein
MCEYGMFAKEVYGKLINYAMDALFSGAVTSVQISVIVSAIKVENDNDGF